ncbi:phenylalanyl-tRNA beta subunit [Grosmannia clavigera kw1407]|uniref:phenylalanine--tRNA ligase n=1 Tax=Grosmannia clavigera (strain kw1407 / UAMH 11150) TaxID=655863 RepID=F0XSN3_GROCL|nr:phenylalanyl-tRNA beta subunit [Grosmannia clavigera kw1407]EFW99363.1 phenylalanyl-tRNA beta subunit [Grosmannia clavigera kw1407]
MGFGVFQEHFSEHWTLAGSQSATGVIGTTSNEVMYLAMPFLFAGLSCKNVVGSTCPFLFRLLLDRLGFRVALRVWAAVTAVSGVVAILLVSGGGGSSGLPAPDHRSRSVPWNFLRHSTFYVYAVATVLQSSGYGIPQTYLNTYAHDVTQLSGGSATLLLTLFNIPSIASSAFFGFLSDDRVRQTRFHPLLRLHLLSTPAVTGLSAVSSALAAWLLWGLAARGDMALLVLFALVFGFFAGGYSATWAGVMSDLEREAALRNEPVDSGFVYGLLNGARGIGYISGGFISVSLLQSGTAAVTAATGSTVGAHAGYSTSYGPLIIFTGLSTVFGGCGLLWKAGRANGRAYPTRGLHRARSKPKMPTIAVDKYRLFEELGQTFTPDAFQDLAFEFGVEVDEDTEDDPSRPKDEPPELKIEIGANRYDMLCFEGIAMNLNVFRGKIPMPQFQLLDIPVEKLQTITVSKETARVRPFVAGAILRDVTFDKAVYDSFISLQDKLHQNLARQRTLVSIGTHDLDTIQGPFTYEAQAPKDINFVPLNQTKTFAGDELMSFYETDRQLGRYLHIIRDKDVYPVIYDANRVVCSLPPIINSEHSKITLKTKNVFIEITATDETKLDIVCNMMVTMFSRYCAKPFTVEPVRIVSEHNGTSRITPSLTTRVVDVEVRHINEVCGLNESPEALGRLLKKVTFSSVPSADGTVLHVSVPPTRADILHPCDIVEDVAVAYGFNNLPRSSPNKAATIGRPLPINKLADIVRLEAAMAGWIEVMPLILCSHDENFAWLNRRDDGQTAVRLANPKTAEYQVVRTSLLPGLLKTIRENKSVPLPIMINEVSDVTIKDESVERKARNERHWAAAYSSRSAGFEQVHGLLDRVMLMLRCAFLTREEGLTSGSGAGLDGYFIREIDDPTFFPGRAAAIYVRIGGESKRIGELGVLHPTVLEAYDLRPTAHVLLVRHPPTETMSDSDGDDVSSNFSHLHVAGLVVPVLIVLGACTMALVVIRRNRRTRQGLSLNQQGRLALARDVLEDGHNGTAGTDAAQPGQQQQLPSYTNGSRIQSPPTANRWAWTNAAGIAAMSGGGSRVRRREDGLNELGEAPPPYEMAAMHTKAAEDQVAQQPTPSPSLLAVPAPTHVRAATAPYSVAPSSAAQPQPQPADASSSPAVPPSLPPSYSPSVPAPAARPSAADR